MTDDPLDGMQRAPPLRDQLAPYLGFGDAELAVSLLAYQKMHPTQAFGSPADVGADYHCPDCEKDVRGVSRPDDPGRRCPICGELPGMLVLGRGPEGTEP